MSKKEKKYYLSNEISVINICKIYLDFSPYLTLLGLNFVYKDKYVQTIAALKIYNFFLLKVKVYASKTRVSLLLETST